MVDRPTEYTWQTGLFCWPNVGVDPRRVARDHQRVRADPQFAVMAVLGGDHPEFLGAASEVNREGGRFSGVHEAGSPDVRCFEMTPHERLPKLVVGDVDTCPTDLEQFAAPSELQLKTEMTKGVTPRSNDRLVAEVELDAHLGHVSLAFVPVQVPFQREVPDSLQCVASQGAHALLKRLGGDDGERHVGILQQLREASYAVLMRNRYRCPRLLAQTDGGGRE